MWGDWSKGLFYSNGHTSKSVAIHGLCRHHLGYTLHRWGPFIVGTWGRIIGQIAVVGCIRVNFLSLLFRSPRKRIFQTCHLLENVLNVPLLALKGIYHWKYSCFSRGLLYAYGGDRRFPLISCGVATLRGFARRPKGNVTPLIIAFCVHQTRSSSGCPTT